MVITIRRVAGSLIVLATAAAIAALPIQARAQDSAAQRPIRPPVVFAAASLKTALDAIATDWKGETGKAVTLSYASSAALARQIEQGAPADIFISADLEWMDWLAQRNLIKTTTRQILLGNTLVLIAPADAEVAFKIAPGADLGRALGNGRLAIGETKSVPAGKYAKAALEQLGMWAGVQNRLAQSDNVRAALAFVARGEAPLGIVYATDAKAEPKVKVIDTFPASSHAAILYPVALTAASTNADAALFFAFLRSPAAIREFTAQGFSMIGQ